MLNFFKNKKDIKFEDLYNNIGYERIAGTTTEDNIDKVFNNLARFNIKPNNDNILNNEELIGIFEEAEDYETILFNIIHDTIDYYGEFSFTRVHNLDCEIIENPNDYKKVLIQLLKLSDNNIPITNIESTINSLTFTLNEECIKWNFREYNDWIDPNIINKLNKLLTKIDTNDRYAVVFDGQNLIIVYIDQNKLSLFNNLMGLKFKIL